MRVEELSGPFRSPGVDVESHTREPGVIGKIPIGRQDIVAVRSCPADVVSPRGGHREQALGERVAERAGSEGF